MPFVELNQLGFNPEQDAERMVALCSNPAIDEAILAEAGATIKIYKNGNPSSLAQRVTERYSGDESLLLASFVVVEGVDAGVTFSCIKDFVIIDGDNQREVPGANLSSWLLPAYRLQGIGKLAGKPKIEQTRSRVTDPSNSSWHGRTLWTSIHNDNLPSQAATTTSGFRYLHQDPKKPERGIYVLD